MPILHTVSHCSILEYLTHVHLAGINNNCIVCFVNPGNAPIQGEVLKKQEDLYTALDVKPLLASAKTSEA